MGFVSLVAEHNQAFVNHQDSAEKTATWSLLYKLVEKIRIKMLMNSIIVL